VPAPATSASSDRLGCSYQQQTDDAATAWQPPTDFYQQQPPLQQLPLQSQQQECAEDFVVPLGWLCTQGGSTAAGALQQPDPQQQQQRKRRSTELVAVTWLQNVPYLGDVACSLGDVVFEPDTPSQQSASATGLSSAEQRRWACKEHSSTVLIAVPAAASGELDSLAALPLVNPYSTKAAAVVGASSWQGWKSGHTPHMRLAAVDWE
jgi:hypothetical protein